MSNEVNINFENASRPGKVKLYSNAFENGVEFYGKFDQKTVGTRVIIARIAKKRPAESEQTLQSCAGLFKEEIMESLKAGDAVNLFDLCTIKICVDSKKGKNNNYGTGEESPLTVKVTPSESLKVCVRNIQIEDVDYANVEPAIRKIYDRYSQSYSTEITKGKEIRLEGERLKVFGSDSAVFLCPLDSRNLPVEDTEQWILCKKITRNAPKNVEFYVPEEAEIDKPYKIFIKTYYSGGSAPRKTANLIYSDVVTVKNAE